MVGGLNWKAEGEAADNFVFVIVLKRLQEPLTLHLYCNSCRHANTEVQIHKYKDANKQIHKYTKTTLSL